MSTLSVAAAENDRRLRSYRLSRVREQLEKVGCQSCVLFDPINIRYATGSRNLAVWTMHNPGRYVFVPVRGPVILFEFSGSFHLNEGLETIDEQRPSVPWFFFLAGPRTEEKARIWAAEIADLVKSHSGGDPRVALDRCDPAGVRCLAAYGVEVIDAQRTLELARAIKSPEELACLRESLVVAETGVAKLKESLRPGITENELWSLIHQINIANGGEWIETRLMSSGHRTNPWFQESSDRPIAVGDLVGLDTDLIGPNGYLADFSRTFLCPTARPTDEQRRLYSLAFEQVSQNMSLIADGVSFREFSEKCWRMPDEFVPQRYMDLVHGVGLCDEYPRIPYREDFKDWGYDGKFEENMVVSVESYIGAVGGGEGVKLEQQVLVTRTGCEVMSTFPFEEELLA